jgi:hypothetical protein
MAFRFILWGDSSQNDGLTDMFTQQAEAEFRSTYKAQFDDVIPQTGQTQSEPKTLANNSEQTALSNAADAVSGLVQTVADNLNANSTTAEVSEIIQNTSEILTKTEDTLSESSSATASAENNAGNNTDKTEQIKEVNELVETINATSESLKTLNETAVESANTNTNAENPPNEALNDLIKKMKDFLAEIKEKALSLLQALRQPQIQYYYGVEDTIQDAGKKDLITTELTNKQRSFEEAVIKKMLEVDNDKLTLKKETKIKDKLVEQTSVKQKQNELERVLAIKIEETRNKNLFGR